MIHLLLLCVSTLLGLPTLSSAQDLCFEDDSLNNIFTPNGVSDLDGSCCQEVVCAVPCPEEVSAPAIGKLSFLSSLFYYFHTYLSKD